MITTDLEQSQKLKELGAPYSRYLISESGTVFSTYWKEQRSIKQFLVNCYPAVSLREKTFKVHRLVAKVFLPNPKNLPCVNHKDGNKSNNHFSNLEWCTHSENARHAVESGLAPDRKGVKNPRSKLTDSDVLRIRNSAWSNKYLSALYGVSETVISQVKRGIRWSHVPHQNN